MLTTTERSIMGYSDVSSLLWREREALQLLLFKIVSEQLIVSAGQTRWLARANDEIEQALTELRTTDVLRAAEVDALAEELGLANAPSLAELSERAEEPWATIFTDHRAELLSLVGEVEQASEDVRCLLSAGAQAMRDTLLSITRTANTSDSKSPTASMTSAVAEPLLMDEQA